MVQIKQEMKSIKQLLKSVYTQTNTHILRVQKLQFLFVCFDVCRVNTIWVMSS